MGSRADIPWRQLQGGSVYVVDMQMLTDRGKKLVFGRAVRELSDLMESEDKKLDAIVVFVDELNKFAPSGSIRRPLKSRLVDITARGRSMGLVLVGAEQFASSVEKEIQDALFGKARVRQGGAFFQMPTLMSSQERG
jgi:DNA helicase HerA-like ATPase